MPRGGSRPGAGRKLGAASLRTRQIANRAAASGRTPLEFLLELIDKPYPDGATPAVIASYDSMRLDAAKACAPYIHPRLSSIDPPVALNMPQGGLAEQGRAIAEAMATGMITPAQAATMMQALSTLGRVVEVEELEKRITALEEANGR